MRRIIERVVTVMTTTTWKISWEPDTLQPDSSSASASNDLTSPDAIPQTTRSANKAKEVHSKPIESETNPKTDEPSNETYPSETERKSKS